MKITVEMDCTPAEARAFFGLPDIAPMQEKMLEELQQKVSNAVNEIDAETVIKQWLPLGLDGVSQMQKMFMNSMMDTVGSMATRAGGIAGDMVHAAKDSASKDKDD